MLTPEMFEDETAAEILAIVSSVQNKDSWLEDSTWTEESEDKSQTSVSLLPTDLRLKKKSISKICSTSELAQARLVVNHRVAQSFSKWENRNNVSLDEPVQVKAIGEVICLLSLYSTTLCKKTLFISGVFKDLPPFGTEVWVSLQVGIWVPFACHSKNVYTQTKKMVKLF
jgi:hypothetical protein